MVPAVSVAVVLTGLPGLTLAGGGPGGLVVTYRVGDPAVVLASGLSVTGSSAQLSGATVTIGVKSAGDVLNWAPSAVSESIALGGYDMSSGLLTLIGDGTVAQYEAALRAVT